MVLSVTAVKIWIELSWKGQRLDQEGLTYQLYHMKVQLCFAMISWFELLSYCSAVGKVWKMHCVLAAKESKSGKFWSIVTEIMGNKYWLFLSIYTLVYSGFLSSFPFWTDTNLVSCMRTAHIWKASPGYIWASRSTSRPRSCYRWVPFLLQSFPFPPWLNWQCQVQLIWFLILQWR